MPQTARRGAFALLLTTTQLLWTTRSTAEVPPSCPSVLGRDDVVRCASHAPEVIASRQDLEVARARESSASAYLPSRPSLSLALGRRTAAPQEPSATVWSAELAQELEIAGQRGARRQEASARLRAERYRVDLLQRQTVADALDAYFEALAATERKKLAEAQAEAATALAKAAKARADAGLAPAIEADLAEAAAIRVGQERFAAERDLQRALARLAALVGRDPTQPLVVEGELVPLALPARLEALIDRALEDRPDVAALEAEREAEEARASLYRRQRIPNPTLSVFAEREGPDELRLGVGLAFPLPLPDPLVPNYRGEIAEASALAAGASAKAEAIRLRARAEVTAAARALASRKREAEAFSPEVIDRARRGLEALAAEVEAGRLPLRDALLAQQSLLELLRSHLDARLELCRASVELLRTSALSLDEVSP